MVPGRPTRRLAALVLVVLLTTACAASGTAPADPGSVPDTAPGPPPDDDGLGELLAARVLAATVGIDGVACGRLASGSGFAISESLVVTSAHVVRGIDRIRIHTFDGDEREATAVAYDPDADLAVLQVPGATFTPLELTGDAGPGTTGMLAGWSAGTVPDPSPFRVERRVTVRIETVGGTERVERPAWLVAADVEAGDSGAALVDHDGAVIGVAFATSTATPGVAYAVRTSALEDLLARGIDANLTVPGC